MDGEIGRMALVCPDKFRGSLSAPEAADAMAAGLERAGVAEVQRVPLADGGEGTLDALVAARGGTRRKVRVTGPLGEPVEAEYAVLRDGTAVVETARASGLRLVGAAGNRPLDATTRGTGELMAAALGSGARRVVVGVGGSAATDGGLGALEALRWSLRGAEVTVACDVAAPFLDAARRFGPQKGASPREVEMLSRRLARLAGDYQARTGVDVATLPGSGAAGGLAGGLAALGARLEWGFEVVARAVRLEEALEGAWLVVTGEGRLDASSFDGKVVGSVAAWSRACGVRRLGIVAGTVDESVEPFLPPTARVRSLRERAFDDEDAFARAALLVEEAALDLGRWGDG